MLNDGTVTANIPAADLKRARAFYSEKLGLEPVADWGDELLVYRTAGGSTFTVYRTEYAGQAGHTIAQWHVDDVDEEVRALRSRGVTFEHYDLPGATWEGDVVSMDEGKVRGAWFTDSEGNVLCVDSGLPDA